MRRGAAAVVVAALLGALAITACATPAHPLITVAPAHAVVFVDVAVVQVVDIDSNLVEVHEHRDVVVEGDRITQVGATGSVAAPAGAELVDGRGKSLVAGFVDAHTHVSGPGVVRGREGLTRAENFERYLASGVTTVFDLGADARELATLRAQIDDGTVIGPRIFNTHFVITGKGSHPIPMSDHLTPYPSAIVGLVLPQVDNDDDVTRVLEALQHEPIHFVKIVVDRMPEGTPILSRELLTTLIAGAKARHLRVFVHAGHVDDAVAAAEAGADVLAHLPWRGRLTNEQAQRLKASGVVVTPTMAMWTATSKALTGTYEPSAADVDVMPAGVIDAARGGVTAPMLVTLGAELAASQADREASLKAVIDVGVPVIVGTDSSLPGSWPGSGYVNEIEALLAAGLSPSSLLVAMTARPARTIAGAAADFGTIEAGRAADLVLVDGDPLTTPRTLTHPLLVLRRGRAVTRLPTTPQTVR